METVWRKSWTLFERLGGLILQVVCVSLVVSGLKATIAKIEQNSFPFIQEIFHFPARFLPSTACSGLKKMLGTLHKRGLQVGAGVVCCVSRKGQKAYSLGHRVTFKFLWVFKPNREYTLGGPSTL